MSDPQGKEPSNRFEVRSTADSHLAWIRTRLALERTMMAYLRTSVALIGFGFAIVQFFEGLHDLPGARHVRFPDAAWYLGLGLISCGVAAAVFSLREYQWSIRYLWSGGFEAIAGMRPEGKNTPLFATAVVLVVIGTFAFFAVLLRLV